ncbi:hypothetical protein OJ998_15950 [Solirubrobacter taibaiensis]|nr:hypothetical protein [Solirubrobacter taibaiensis]
MFLTVSEPHENVVDDGGGDGFTDEANDGQREAWTAQSRLNPCLPGGQP